MDDAKLSKLFRDCPAQSIILIEDMYVTGIKHKRSPLIYSDCVFPSNRGRSTLIVEGDTEGGEETSSVADFDVEADTPAASPHVAGGHDLATSTVTLSGLLNAIDGVSSQEGCVLIAST